MDLEKLKNWIEESSNRAYDFIETIENRGDIVLFGGMHCIGI